jgi:hypothetical protein
MENLISMTDFVLEQSSFLNKAEYRNFSLGMLDFAINTTKYANFLKQPLELWMFVPCVDNEVFNYSKHGNKEQYNKAKERCLFEGFTYDKVGYIDYKHYCINILTLTNLTSEHLIKYDLTLTETAKNMLF